VLVPPMRLEQDRLLMSKMPDTHESLVPARRYLVDDNPNHAQTDRGTTLTPILRRPCGDPVNVAHSGDWG